MLKEGSIVTFGIKPTYPSTEFGYIKVPSSRRKFNFSYINNYTLLIILSGFAVFSGFTGFVFILWPS